MGARVVRRVEVQLRFGEFVRVGRDVLLLLDRVVDRRVDAERDFLAQAVVDDRGDLRAVAGHLRLALDHRGDDQQLVGGDVQGARARDEARVEVFLEGDELLGDEPRDRGCRGTRRRWRGTGSLRGPGSRAARRSGPGSAAASVARPRGSCRAAPPSSRSRAICVRVRPSGITTFTTAGAAGAFDARAQQRVKQQEHGGDHRDQRGNGTEACQRRASAAERAARPAQLPAAPRARPRRAARGGRRSTGAACGGGGLGREAGVAPARPRASLRRRPGHRARSGAACSLGGAGRGRQRYRRRAPRADAGSATGAARRRARRLGAGSQRGRRRLRSGRAGAARVSDGRSALGGCRAAAAPRRRATPARRRRARLAAAGSRGRRERVAVDRQLLGVRAARARARDSSGGAAPAAGGAASRPAASSSAAPGGRLLGGAGVPARWRAPAFALQAVALALLGRAFAPLP